MTTNQINAQKSTGPRTPEGKQRSSLNSLRHGFTGQTLVLQETELEPYKQFTEGYLKDLQPVGVEETDLAHAIMNNRWRLHQIAATESAIYALGHQQYIGAFSTADPVLATALARATTFTEKRAELDRLHRYESRLHRQIMKETAQLQQLQATRKALDARQEKDAIALLTHYTATGKPWNPADFGFVWSIEEIQQREHRHFERARVCKA